MSGIIVSRRGAIAATKSVIPVAFQAVSTLGSAALGFNPSISSSAAAITTTSATGLRVVATMMSYSSFGGGAGLGARSITYDGFAMSEIAGSFIIDTNWYIGWWIITPSTFGAKNVIGTIGDAGNSGRQIWVGAASYVNVGGTAGGAAQLTSAGVGQVIASSTDANEMIANAMVTGATFGSYTQTAKLGPVNVPGQFTCGVLGQAAGGASRTFSNDQPGYSASVRLTP